MCESTETLTVIMSLIDGIVTGCHRFCLNTVMVESRVCYPSQVIIGFVEYVTEMSQEMSLLFIESSHPLKQE